MVLVNTHSTTFTDVVVEFFSGRRSNLTVLHSIEAVLKSLRQPPSFRNTIRSEIIERATCEMSSPTDLIRSIRVVNPFVNYGIADRHIVVSIDGPRISHSWYFPDDSLQSCSESGDGCYTPDSETSSPVEEHNSNDEQSLAEGAPSHRSAPVSISEESCICLASMIGVVKALFDIASYLRANPNVLKFEPWIEVLEACIEHIWIQTCIFGFPIYMFFGIMQVLRGGTG
ncbi:hypothetical protein KCU67_g10978, partial [Aureobasidium melanogenum]